MHDLLLQHQQELRPVHLVRYAADLGLDVDRFREDLRRHVGAARVAEDVDSAGSAEWPAPQRSSSTAAASTAPTTSTPSPRRSRRQRHRRSSTCRIVPGPVDHKQADAAEVEPEAAPRGSIAGGRPQSSSGSAQCSRRSGSGGLTSDYGKSPVGRQGVRVSGCVARAHRCGAPVDSSEKLDRPQRQRPGSHAVGQSNSDPPADTVRPRLAVVAGGRVSEEGLQGAPRHSVMACLRPRFLRPLRQTPAPPSESVALSRQPSPS